MAEYYRSYYGCCEWLVLRRGLFAPIYRRLQSCWHYSIQSLLHFFLLDSSRRTMRWLRIPSPGSRFGRAASHVLHQSSSWRSWCMSKAHLPSASPSYPLHLLWPSSSFGQHSSAITRRPSSDSPHSHRTKYERVSRPRCHLYLRLLNSKRILNLKCI